MAIPFLAVWNLASCSRHKALRMTQVDQRFVWAPSFHATGEDHFLESKKLMCLRSRKWDFCTAFFCQNSHGFNKLQCFGKSNCPSLPKHHVVWNCRMIQGYHPSVSYWRCQLTSRSLCPVVLFGFCLGCFGVVFVLFVCCSCFFLFVFSTVTANWTVYWSCVSSSFVAHLLWRWITSLL